MVEAGWYADPHDPGRLRYWDGTTWTEHTHVPETAVSQPPPFSPPSPPGTPTLHRAPETINDIGQWLRQSLKVAWSRLGVCFVLTLIGFAPFGIVAALVALALFDLDATGSQITGFGGFDVVLLLMAGLVAVGAILWFGVVTIAQYRVLYDAHRDRSIGIGAALAVGRRNIWRLVVAYLIIYAVALAAVLVIVAVGALLFASVDVSFDSPDAVNRISSLLNVVNLITLPLSLWLTVKLAFIPVAAAVAPRGEGLIRLSMRVSDGNFWAVLGRILLLSLVMLLLIFPVQILLLVLFGVGALAVGSSGGDPSIATFVLAAIVGGLVFGIVIYFAQIMQASGVSRLYADLGGPSVE